MYCFNEIKSVYIKKTEPNSYFSVALENSSYKFGFLCIDSTKLPENVSFSTKRNVRCLMLIYIYIYWLMVQSLSRMYSIFHLINDANRTWALYISAKMLQTRTMHQLTRNTSNERIERVRNGEKERSGGIVRERKRERIRAQDVKNWYCLSIRMTLAIWSLFFWCHSKEWKKNKNHRKLEKNV